MKLDYEAIRNYLNQETNSGDCRKTRILCNVPSVMKHFLKPHNPTLTTEERFINCLLDWREEIIEALNKDTEVISDALTCLSDFLVLLYLLNDNPNDKELLNKVIKFDIKRYSKLCKACGIEKVSKALKRMKNFKKISTAFVNDGFRNEDYIVEIKKQIKHFKFIHNKFIGVKDSLEDIPIILALFDVRE